MEIKECKDCNCLKICEKFKCYSEFDCKNSMKNIFSNLEKFEDVLDVNT